MAKIVSSYCTKVIGENRIFKDTIRVYRDALSLLIRIVESEWDTGLGELYAKSTLKAQRTVELLVHASRTSVAKYPEFDKQFYKYPSYLRRSTISEALGAVSSYRAAVSHWESAGRKGKEPKLQTSRSAMPTFYKDNMYEDNGDGTALSETLPQEGLGMGQRFCLESRTQTTSGSIGGRLMRVSA